MRLTRGAWLAAALLTLPGCSRSGTEQLPQRSAPAPDRPATPTTTITPAQLEAGARAVDAIVEAMGGAAAISGVRSVTVTGTMNRPQPNGSTTSAKLSTSVRFPNWYRQELVLPPGKVTTIIGPKGAWILTGSEAPLPLPEERRLEIENIILRNPVALLKTRGSELFSAIANGDALEIRVGSKISRLTLDEQRLIRTITYELPGAKDAPHPTVTVHYADYRRTGGILYPFESHAESAGAAMYRLKLDDAKVNEPLADSLFVPPKSK